VIRNQLKISQPVQPWKWRHYVPPKCRHTAKRRQGATTQKTIICSTTYMSTSSFMSTFRLLLDLPTGLFYSDFRSKIWTLFLFPHLSYTSNHAIFLILSSYYSVISDKSSWRCSLYLCSNRDLFTCCIDWRFLQANAHTRPWNMQQPPPFNSLQQ
jgi:hypothetical protein